MKNNSCADYLLYSLARLFGVLLKTMPPKTSLSIGRVLGTVVFYLDTKHRRLAYANLKSAFGNSKSPQDLKVIVRKMYQHLGQNLIETLIIPWIDKKYLDRYIQIDGRNYISAELNKGQGLIFLTVHLGSWEISNCICAIYFGPYNVVVREQTEHSRLDVLLNDYRRLKGINIIYKGTATRELINCIRDRQLIGMVGDQAGRDGTLVNFFNRLASFPTGALRLSLKYEVPILPAFIIRMSGPHHKVIVYPPLKIEKSGSLEMDLKNNLEKFSRMVEDMVSKYPEQYLWLYKVWKYSPQRKTLILSDNKAGHLRQSQTVATILARELESRGLIPEIKTIEVRFKNRLSKWILNLCYWWGLGCLKIVLEPGSYRELVSEYADIIISCGKNLSLVNYILSKDNLAKSIHIMRPQVSVSRKLNLILAPQHDSCKKRPNLVTTQISPNLIDEKFLQAQTQALLSRLKGRGLELPKQRISLLIGGDTKEYIISKESIKVIIEGLKKLSEKLNLELLVTTSRRTSVQIEDLIKKEFKDFTKCKLLIIASQNNIPEAVGAMLGLSSIVVVSGESISMVSEAVSSGRYVLVFNPKRRFGRFGITRHKRFLHNLQNRGFISLIKPQGLSDEVVRLLSLKPPIRIIDDNELIREALGKIM